MKNFEKILCVILIAFYTGLSVGVIGDMPESCDEPYPWFLPLMVLTWLSAPAIFAYLAGRRDGQGN